MTARKYDVDAVLRAHGVDTEVWYTSSQVCRLFGRRRSWLTWIMRQDSYSDPRTGERFTPSQEDSKGYLWSGEDVINLGVVCQKNRIIDMTKLRSVVRAVLKDRGEINGKY